MIFHITLYNAIDFIQKKKVSIQKTLRHVTH